MKKNASIFNLLLVAAFPLLFFGCRKDFTKNQANPLLSSGKQNNILKTLGVPPDVYVAGSEGGQAKYWKNGQEFVLPGGSRANGIVIVGTDVYVCGVGPHPSTQIQAALYWKNGVLTILSDGQNSASANGIAVSGTDVYVAGRVGVFVETGVYWKNGVATSLGSGTPIGVFVAPNGDVYMPNSKYGTPSYWKNGVLVTLPSAVSGYSYVTNMAVHGTDVFVVGVKSTGPSETALYWENGILQPLFTQFNTTARAIATTATGQPIISGTTGQNISNMHISYWDVIGDLHILSSGRFVAASTGIAVDQTTDDIYVCGSEYEAPGAPLVKAKYWRISSTGVITTSLGSGTTDATALAITLGW